MELLMAQTNSPSQSLVLLHSMEFPKQNQQKLQVLVFTTIFFSFLRTLSSTFTPLDNHLINCGSASTTSPEDGDNRVFVGDGNYTTDGVPISNPSPPLGSSSLYQTARVFKSQSSYELPIGGDGLLVVRLHFSPFTSQNFNLEAAVFDVSLSGSQVLSNFSPRNANGTPKEFLFKPRPSDTKKLGISFLPSTASLAFVNAIEVLTAPKNFIPDEADNSPMQSTKYSGLLNHVIETVHRINVGGRKVTPSSDTFWRTWLPDLSYLRWRQAAKQTRENENIKYKEVGLPEEIAPPSVYGSAQEMNNDSNSLSQNFNITWMFPVDSSCTHLVRLHFCDITSTGQSNLLFNVYIGNYYAFQNLDLYRETRGYLAAPYYKDFIVDPHSWEGYDNLTHMKISVGPTDGSKNAILNGVEIMKVLSVQGPVSHSHLKMHFKALIGVVIGGLALISMAIVLLLISYKCMKQKNVQSEPTESTTWTPVWKYGESSQGTARTIASLGPRVHLGLVIPFTEIQLATGNFSANSVIGTGGFGNVYKGVLRDGVEVAVKRSNRESSQGLREFLAEITVLSKIHHRHLVSLIGYCEERSEMILVYEFMENGSLKDHLYGKDFPCLSWKQRLQICVGAARGLHYLHTHTAQGTIHRDVKSSNILLDGTYLAKVADFGLSRTMNSENSDVVSTKIKGTFGYLDPEYFKRHHLTSKSDVYSFGVLLLEVLCARPVIDLSLQGNQVSLVEWALLWQKKGLLADIIDPRLRGTIDPYSLRKFGETAEKCLAEYGDDRPTMGDVLWNLEYALQLQETEMHRLPHEDSTVTAFEPHLPLIRRLPSSSTDIEGQSPDITRRGASVTKSEVFSQFFSSDGR